MTKKIMLLLLLPVVIGMPLFSKAQSEESWTYTFFGERIIMPSYRITEQPSFKDTIIATSTVQYPLLNRNMRTQITVTPIEASKIKIVDKLDKLYPGYIMLGVGNYSSPLGELYYNSMRNRKVNYGIALKHNSSFGDIKGYAPSSFDNTTGRLFGDFFTSGFRFQPEFNYSNHGYHFYGLRDSAGVIPDDSLDNRVQGIGGGLKFSNYTSKDSAILLYTIYTNYFYFHEFQQDTDSLGLNGKNNSFSIGTDMRYKFKKNIFNLAFDINYNQYNYNRPDTAFAAGYQANEQTNWLIHLRPSIATYGPKWKINYGVDLNIDTPSDTVFKVIPVVEAKYSLFNDMFIPYLILDGGVEQQSFHRLNRINPYILTGTRLYNTKTFNASLGIKGTLSKNISFNVRGYYKAIDHMPLFVNDTLFSDLYRFRVTYDRVTVVGAELSFSYQLDEKLKLDLIGAYNDYTTDKELYAWNLPEYVITFRGNYNLFEKIYVKADFELQGGRKSPGGLFATDQTTADYDLGILADANLHFEYRYTPRLSAFLQFNNLAAQSYQRWYGYPVQGFQVLGGLTFGF
jgi:hypothetical protein